MNRRLTFIAILLSICFLVSTVAVITPGPVAAKPQAGVALKILVSDQQVPIIQQVVNNFTSTHPDVASITVVASGTRSDDQHSYLVTSLTAKSSEFDIIGMDVIWPAEFASNGWLVDLSSIFNSTNTGNYVPAQVQAMTYNGKIIAAPFFVDSGIVLYRKDILQRNGLTINDFKNWTGFQANLNKILDNATEAALNPNLQGYVFQGDAYEGGVVNLLEWMGASGGSFLTDSGTKGNFSATAGPAMTYWQGLIAPRYTSILNNNNTNAVSDRSQLVGDEGSAEQTWLAGNAVFQRNWPFSYVDSLSNAFLNGTVKATFANGTQQPDPWPLGQSRVGITTLPYNATICGPNNEHHCKTQALGGAVLGVPVYSTHQAEAKEFLLYLASHGPQLEMIKKQGNLPALTSVYTSHDLDNSPLSWTQSFYTNVMPNLLPRPVNPKYIQISQAIQPLFHNGLSGATPINTTLKEMDTAVDQILASGQAPGFTSTVVFIGLFSIATLALIIKFKRKNQLD